MNQQQQQSLNALRNALEAATDCGLLDQVSANCPSGGTVNDFCDAVEYLSNIGQKGE